MPGRDVEFHQVVGTVGEMRAHRLLVRHERVDIGLLVAPRCGGTINPRAHLRAAVAEMLADGLVPLVRVAGGQDEFRLREHRVEFAEIERPRIVGEGVELRQQAQRLGVQRLGRVMPVGVHDPGHAVAHQR